MNNRRQTDKTVVGRWYSKRVPQVHLAEIITLSVLAVAAIAAWVTVSVTVDAHGKTLVEQTDHMGKLDQLVAEQKAISARIEQKVDYIREDMKSMRGRNADR